MMTSDLDEVIKFAQKHKKRLDQHTNNSITHKTLGVSTTKDHMIWYKNSKLRVA